MSIFRRATKRPKQLEGASGSVSQTAPCQQALTLQVEPTAVAPVRAAVVAEFQKRVTLPGFRKGKVPPELVEQKFLKPIEDETVERVTQQVLRQAVDVYELRPVGPFEVRRVEQTAQGLRLEATVEVEPEFTLGAYRGIAVTRPSGEVTSQDVEHALTSLRESRTQLVPGPEGEAKTRQVPELNDEFAKELGFDTVAVLRQHLEAKLREQKRAAQAQAVETALCAALLERNPFELPPRLVASQAQRLVRDFKARLLFAGVPESQADEELAKFHERMRQNAEQHVRLTFILDRIAAKESVSVTQDELVKRLWDLARREGKDPAALRTLMDSQGLWPSVVATLRREKTLALVAAAASITNGAPEPQAPPPE